MITHSTLAMLQGPTSRIPVTIEFSYDPVRCALAVGMAIETGSHWVEWTFARELLTDGIVGGAGEGDVFVVPDSRLGGVWITLTNPTGRARLHFSRDDLVDFIAETEELVPFGAERVDLDALVREVTSS